ncbi:MAG: type IV secretion system DNA-binding domain-containing protein [Gemmataceae bacterium]
MLALLRVPADNNRGPLFMEHALAGIHQGIGRRTSITFGIETIDGSVSLTCRFPAELQRLVESQLFAQYPDAGCTLVAEPQRAPGSQTWHVEVTLAPTLFPIRRHAQFEDNLNRQLADPMSALIAAVQHAGRLHARVEITVRPARRRLKRRAERCLKRLATPFFRDHPHLAHRFAEWSLSRHGPVRFAAWIASLILPRGEMHAKGMLHQSATRHDREDDLQAASDKLGRLLFEARIRLSIDGPADDEQQAAAILHELAGAFGQFSAPRLARFHTGPVRTDGSSTGLGREAPFLLSTEELATLFHPATATVRGPAIAQVESREFPPPVTLPTPEKSPDIAVLGVTSYRGTSRSFGLLPDDRRRHLAILGKTGMGKTTLLHHLIASDIRAGRGIGLVDPHGDLAEALLDAIPPHRTNDVVVFDAGDTDHPLSFNVLDCPQSGQRPLVASGVLSAFKKLYGDSWGPRLEHILRNALLALLDVPGTSLVSLLRLLSEPRFRAEIASHVADPVVRTFWQREFAGMPVKLQIEAVAPVQNKIGAFVSSPILRNIIGQTRNALPLRRLMDEGKIILCNLSKGRIGDDASALLGSFLVTAIQLAAMSRANVPERERRDFWLYVDEFQNFATESFASILSEARKYRLGLTVANQYLAQIDEATLNALFGNVGTLVAFQAGARDAELLAEQFGDLTSQDLLRLPRYQAYSRLLIEGMPSPPFSMRTLPPPSTRRRTARPTVIRRTSRHRFARPRAQAEQEIAAALHV